MLIIRKGLNYSRVHTLHNASAVALLPNGIGTYLYASAYAYHEVHGGRAPSTAWADPLLLPNMSTNTTQLHASGSEDLRVEKIVRITTLPGAHKYLHVCLDETQPSSCSQCIKCFYTQLTLEHMGKLDEFSGCFDRKTYQRVRHKMVGKILTGRAPYRVEPREFLRATGLRFSWQAWLHAVMGRRQLKELIWRLIADKRQTQLIRDRISSSEILIRSTKIEY